MLVPCGDVQVGMGTLAGSTILLITIGWGGSILLGRCDMRPDRNRRGSDWYAWHVEHHDDEVSLEEVDCAS